MKLSPLLQTSFILYIRYLDTYLSRFNSDDIDIIIFYLYLIKIIVCWIFLMNNEQSKLI
jgi:hypothetical protein